MFKKNFLPMWTVDEVKENSAIMSITKKKSVLISSNKKPLIKWFILGKKIYRSKKYLQHCL